MKPLVSMREALDNEQLLGSAFTRPAATGWLFKKPQPDSWLAWKTTAIALAGEKLTAQERPIFQTLSGLEKEPMQRPDEVEVLKPRRCGGTSAMAAVVSYFAGLCKYDDVLGVGERATALLLAPSQRQAQIAFSRVCGIFDRSPLLSGLVTGRTQDSLSLSNRVDIEVRAASAKNLRGLTLCVAVLDEAAFFQHEGGNSDSEITNALRPALATTRGPLILSSTPYAQSGEVWSNHEKYFGKEGPVLVLKGTAELMNPTLPRSIITRALERDPAAARSEFLVEFRADISSFIGRDLLTRAVDAGISSRPPMPGIRYFAFGDASSGIAASGDGDRYAVAIGHLDGDVVVIDFAKEWRPPFNASAVTAEAAEIVKVYGISEITTDGFSSGFVRSELARHGIGHRISELDKSGLYLASLPMLTSNKVRLLDLPDVVDQFAALERRPGSSGRDRIDARGHEDSANACAGVIASLSVAHPDPNILVYYERWNKAQTAAPAPTAAQAHPQHLGFELGIKPVAITDAVRIVAPPGNDCTTLGSRSGTTYQVKIDNGQRVFYVSRADAIELLDPLNAHWCNANLELAARLGKERVEAPAIPVQTYMDALEAQRPRHPLDRVGQVNDTLRMMGRLR